MDELHTILRVSISPMARVSSFGLATAIGGCFGSGSFPLDLNLFQKPAADGRLVAVVLRRRAISVIWDLNEMDKRTLEKGACINKEKRLWWVVVVDIKDVNVNGSKSVQTGLVTMKTRGRFRVNRTFQMFCCPSLHDLILDVDTKIQTIPYAPRLAVHKHLKSWTR